MSLCPEAQRKAQKEIGSVIGNGRLPTAADRPRLPYVDAVMKECLRILPAAPLGVPHSVREEDKFLGYRIPKETVVYANIWRVLHDPRIYDDPHTFFPERHLSACNASTKRYRDPATYAFGFGRRVCPGQHLAEATLFSAIAATLAVFDIKGVEGIWKAPKPTTGAFSHPGDFSYELHSRRRLDDVLEHSPKSR